MLVQCPSSHPVSTAHMRWGGDGAVHWGWGRMTLRERMRCRDSLMMLAVTSEAHPQMGQTHTHPAGVWPPGSRILVPQG